MGILICPVCGEKLDLSDRSYVCTNRHSFDKAKSGYVNLLLSKHIGKTVHGDNKLMVQARRDFLEKGYYAPLKDALCEIVSDKLEGNVVLDAGCGEGYYTTAIYDKLNSQQKSVSMYGIDISKIAVEAAAKRKKNITFAAASVFHISVLSDSCDMLVTMFAPYCGTEYARVLRKGGIMTMAVPSTEHLWELKKAIYDIPYLNEVKPFDLEGFDFIGHEHIAYNMELGSQQDVQSLFSMTPYYYRTGRDQQQRLEQICSICTKADFELLIYRKK